MLNYNSEIYLPRFSRGAQSSSRGTYGSGRSGKQNVYSSKSRHDDYDEHVPKAKSEDQHSDISEDNSGNVDPRALFENRVIVLVGQMITKVLTLHSPLPVDLSQEVRSHITNRGWMSSEDGVSTSMDNSNTPSLNRGQVSSLQTLAGSSICNSRLLAAAQ